MIFSNSKIEWVASYVHDSVIKKQDFCLMPVTSTSHSKYDDVGYIHKYVQDGAVEIAFVKSTDTDSDTLTKNLRSEFHTKHSTKMTDEKPILEDKREV